MNTAAPHTAVILAIGDELVLGESLDTNSKYLSSRLWELGIRVIEHRTLGDDIEQISEAIRQGGCRASIVITTGGLGPTEDDLTRDALAIVLGEPLEQDPDILAWLRSRFERFGKQMSDRQLVQTRRPASARWFENNHGTAPALHARLPAGSMGGETGRHVFCLPGPPRELRPIVERHVLPMLERSGSGGAITRFVSTLGIGESDAADRLGGLLARDRDPQVGITASGGVVTCRVRTSSADAAAVDATTQQVAGALAPYTFGVGAGQPDPYAMLLDELRNCQQTLATVESCTGGGIAAAITAIPGSSDIFLGSLVTYSNAMKERLVGVTAELLDTHGAVSSQVAQAMAIGALNITGADHTMAVTGIAGPSGGSDAKPVGTVWITCASRSSGSQLTLDTRLFRFPGDRSDIRQRAATSAVALLLLRLRNSQVAPNLLWQIEA